MHQASLFHDGLASCSTVPQIVNDCHMERGHKIPVCLIMGMSVDIGGWGVCPTGKSFRVVPCVCACARLGSPGGITAKTYEVDFPVWIAGLSIFSCESISYFFACESICSLSLNMIPMIFYVHCDSYDFYDFTDSFVFNDFQRFQMIPMTSIMSMIQKKLMISCEFWFSLRIP